MLGVALDRIPADLLNAGEMLARAPGTLSVEWICGAVAPLGNGKFRIALDRTWPHTPVYLAVCHRGTSKIRDAVQPGGSSSGGTLKASSRRSRLTGFRTLRYAPRPCRLLPNPTPDCRWTSSSSPGLQSSRTEASLYTNTTPHAISCLRRGCRLAMGTQRGTESANSGDSEANTQAPPSWGLDSRSSPYGTEPAIMSRTTPSYMTPMRGGRSAHRWATDRITRPRPKPSRKARQTNEQPALLEVSLLDHRAGPFRYQRTTLRRLLRIVSELGGVRRVTSSRPTGTDERVEHLTAASEPAGTSRPAAYAISCEQAHG